MTDQLLPVRRALLSVSDKAGIAEFARALVAAGAELLSTGGTAAHLRAAGLPVTEVSDHTGFPEILDGRVKTLVPQIHGGLLGRRDDPAHVAQMAAHGIAPIDLLCVDLYPFEAAVAAGADAQTAIERIDIGGPAMIRSAAKNHTAVAVLTDPAQLAEVAAEIAAQGGTTLATRQRLAAAAFARTAAYDAAIAAWFARDTEAPPARLTIAGTLRQALRYGENPHQTAAFYSVAEARPGVATAAQHGGKALSYNNLADADAAFECVAEFARPAIVIVKHGNPCGAAEADDLATAWDAALASDPLSAFGGVIAANRALDGDAAARIAEIFTEVVIAPEADATARERFAAKRNLRLLLTGAAPDPAAPGSLFRSVAGGFLHGARDAGRIDAADLRVVTRRAPTTAELADLLFAWRVCKHAKSNAIVLARGGATIGIGAGQTSRVDAARAAVARAGDRARGAALASDAFFPFADGLQVALDAGIACAIQPGGSVRDAEVIAAADAAGVAMVFTGMRHFRH